MGERVALPVLQAACLDLLVMYGPMTREALVRAWQRMGADLDVEIAMKQPEGTPPKPTTWPRDADGRWYCPPSETPLHGLVRAGLAVRVEVPGAYHAPYGYRPSRPAVVWGLTTRGVALGVERQKAHAAATEAWRRARDVALVERDRLWWPHWLRTGQVHEAPTRWPGIVWVSRPMELMGERRWSHNYRRVSDWRETSSVCLDAPSQESGAPPWLVTQGERLAVEAVQP